MAFRSAASRGPRSVDDSARQAASTRSHRDPPPDEPSSASRPWRHFATARGRGSHVRVATHWTNWGTPGRRRRAGSVRSVTPGTTPRPYPTVFDEAGASAATGPGLSAGPRGGGRRRPPPRGPVRVEGRATTGSSTALIFPTDAEHPWTFTIRGHLQCTEGEPRWTGRMTMLVRWDYAHDRQPAWGKGRIGWVPCSRADSPERSAEVAAA